MSMAPRWGRQGAKSRGFRTSTPAGSVLLDELGSLGAGFGGQRRLVGGDAVDAVGEQGDEKPLNVAMAGGEAGRLAVASLQQLRQEGVLGPRREREDRQPGGVGVERQRRRRGE